MKKMILVSTLVLIGCSSLATTTVSLTKQEAIRAQAIAETRQQIAFARQEAQIEYQQKLNHLADQENTLNLQATKLCFDFKKGHKLPPNAREEFDDFMRSPASLGRDAYRVPEVELARAFVASPVKILDGYGATWERAKKQYESFKRVSIEAMS